MANKIIVHPQFERDAKPLAKKYPSFSHGLRELVDGLKINSQIGTSLAGTYERSGSASRVKALEKAGVPA